MQTKSATLITALLLSGCASVSGIEEDHASLDALIDQKVSTFCPLPDASLREQRVLRANIVLAAIAGYGHRSIQSYSAQTEIKDDAQRLVGRIEEANRAIGQAKAKVDQYLFPVYRTDMVIEIAEAAEAALRPTLRAAKSTVTSTGTDRIKRLKAAFIRLLEDSLYLRLHVKIT